MSILAAAKYKNEQLPTSGIGIPSLSNWMREWLGGTDTASGIKVDNDNAISIATVFNALTLLSESISQLPLAPYIDEGDNRRKYIEHPSYKLVSSEPNEWMSSQTFRKVMQSHLCRYDRAYALISRNRRGEPTELFPLHPKWVSKKINKNREVAYEVSDFYGSGESVLVEDVNMLHLIGYTDNGLEGKSRVNILAEALGNTQAAERFTGQYFGKGIHVSGFLKTDKMLKDEAAVDRLKTAFAQKYAGVDSKFGVGLLEGGTEWVPNELEPEKAQLNETRKVNAKTIAQIWNIPLPLLKELENATYNNVEQLDIQFVKYSLAPWVVNWEQELNRKLLTEREKERGNVYFKHNLNAFLRGDMAARGQFYERMLKHAVYSPNDVRKLEEANPYEGGNVHIVNPGAQTIEQLQNTIENL